MTNKSRKKIIIWIIGNVFVFWGCFYYWISTLLPKLIPDFVDSWQISGYRSMGFKYIRAEYANNFLGLYQHFWDLHFFYTPDSVALLIAVGACATWMVIFFIQVMIISVIEERCIKK